jgi:hypothetical protein
MRHKKISSIISIHGRPAYDPCGGGGGVVVAQGGTAGFGSEISAATHRLETSSI